MVASLTHRDREYIRVIFSLHGEDAPVGPVELAKKMGVSKECAYQKMRRLTFFGYGEYHLYKGFQLNKKAVQLVEEDTKRHHVIEQFLQKTLDMSHHQACKEATKMDSSISAAVYNHILHQFSLSPSPCCGYDPSKQLTPKEIKQCPWFQRIIPSKNI